MVLDLPVRKTIRLKDFDYSQFGWYYVTVCTHDRRPSFGRCFDNQMRLSTYGQIANLEWVKLRLRFPHIQLDQFVVMPNHVHGIVYIKTCGREDRAPTLGQIIAYYKYQTTKSINNSLVGARSSRPSPMAGSSRPSPMARSSRPSPMARSSRPQSYPKLWQRNYYEHIVRDDRDLNRIREYIQNNPLNWKKDTLNMSP